MSKLADQKSRKQTGSVSWLMHHLVQTIRANSSDGGSWVGGTVLISVAKRSSMNSGLDVVLVNVARVVTDDDEVAAHRQAEAGGQRLAQLRHIFEPGKVTNETWMQLISCSASLG